jgi:GntR family transcriptional regulator/MocR family aminotransferase
MIDDTCMIGSVRDPIDGIDIRPIHRRHPGPADVHVSLVGRADLSGEIYRQLRSAILERRLRAGERLPPTRELAQRLGVSRTTTSVAYDRLISEGFAVGHVGAGTFVGRVAASPDGQRPVPAAIRPLPNWQSIPLPTYLWTPAEYDFRPGLPDTRLFPLATWRRLMSRQFQPSGVGWGASEHPAGHLPLRAAIAHHVGLARGVRAEADDVVVTNGTQQAIDLIARILLRPRDQVAVEDPGYTPPIRLLRAIGAQVRGIPVDGEGLIVDQIPAGTKLVYVTPSHQYPLGMSMPLARRSALLAWARRHDAAIVEDDYDSEFRYRGRPIEPLQLLDTTGRVIYVGSFSKTTLPSLRLGFIVAPPSIRTALHGARYLADWHSPVPVQSAMAEFIASGQFARHVRRMRLVYERRHGLVSELLATRFADVLQVIPSAAGLHVSAFAPGLSNENVEGVVRRASSLGVECQPLSIYSLEGSPRAGIVLGYGAIEADRIAAGLTRLREAFDS